MKGSRQGYWRLRHPPLGAASEQPKEDGVIAMLDFQQTGQRKGECRPKW